MVTAVETEGLLVVIVKILLVDPAGIVTLVGTEASTELLLVSATTAPPEGAALLNKTVPWEVFVPITVVGFMVNEVKTA